MALVSRRTLQRLIRENAGFTTLTQRTRHADALNRADVESLSVEWELLVLSGLSRSAAVRHEVGMGRRCPDVLAALGSESHAETFIADIATAFGEANDERNPIRAFSDELHTRAWRRGLRGHGFYIEASGHTQGPSGRQRMALTIPPKRSFAAFFERAIEPFLGECAHDPQASRRIDLTTDQVNLSIAFRPNTTTSGMSYPSYTTNYSKTRNTLFNILKAKATQLRETEFEGPRGVVLCGADVDLSPRQRPGYGLRDITAEIFRQNKSLSFVLSLWVPQRTQGVLTYRSDLYENPEARHPLAGGSRSTLRALSAVLPPPQVDGVNAVNQLKFWRWKRGRYFFGLRRENRTMVEISARVLLQYLAGQIDRGEFLKGLGDDRHAVSAFERRLRHGQLLTNITLRPEPDRDDDWVTFHFGDADPAVAAITPE